MRSSRRIASVVAALRVALSFVLLFAFAQGCSSDDAVVAAPAPAATATTTPPPGQGILRVQITGLPEGQKANVVVTGPNGFERTLAASAELPVPAGEISVIGKAVADAAKRDGTGFGVEDGEQAVTVTADAGASVLVAYRPVTPKVAPEARPVTADTASLIESITGDGTGPTTIVFSQTNAETTGWKVDDLLVLGISKATPGGFLGRIVTTDGKTIVTKPAAIDELIEEGVLDIAQDFSPEEAVSIVPNTALARDFRLCGSLSAGFGVTAGNVGGDIRVGGDLCFRPHVDFNIGFRGLRKRPNLYFGLAAGITGEIYLEATGSVSLTVSKPILTITLAPIAFAIGPVPVIIFPQFQIVVGVSGQITAGVRLGMDYGLNPAVSFFRDGKTGRVTTRASETHSFGAKKPEPTVTATAKVFGGPHFQFMFYKIAGPFVGAEAYAALVVDLLKFPSWELHAGSEVKLGFELNPLLADLQFAVVPISYDTLILKSNDVFPGGSPVREDSTHTSLENIVRGPSDIVYMAMGNDIRAVPTVGPELWKYTGTAQMKKVLRAADGDLYAHDVDGNVYALSPSGNMRWTQPLGAEALASPSAQVLYVGSASGVSAVQTSNGTASWTTDVGGSVKSISIAKDGTVYATTIDSVVALTPAGVVKWPSYIGSIAAPEAAIGPDGTLYLSYYDPTARVVAIAPDGNPKWTAPALNSDGVSSPVVDGLGRVVLCGNSPQAAVVALSALNGKKLWTVPLTYYNVLKLEKVVESCEGAPAISAEGTVFVGTDSSIWAVNALTGLVRWRSATPGDGGAPRGSPVFLSLGNVVVANSGGLYEFSAIASPLPFGWGRAGRDASGAGAAQ